MKRAQKLLEGRYCRPHKLGVPHGYPPFFVPGCVTCEARKAAGKVTGEEPLPPTAKATVQRQNGGWIDWEAKKRQGVAKRRALAEGAYKTW